MIENEFIIALLVYFAFTELVAIGLLILMLRQAWRKVEDLESLVLSASSSLRQVSSGLAEIESSYKTGTINKDAMK